MLALSATIVLITFASIANGLTLEHIENDKICTSWMYLTGDSINVDSSPCSSNLAYETAIYNNQYIIRFCCTYNTTTGPEIGPAPGQCGVQSIPPIRTRIVGGQEATAHSWPWIVSLQYGGSHFCGGTLIDESHVLTAAHCFQDPSMFNSYLTVVAGLHRRSQANPQEIQRKQVASIINHPGYNDATNFNDVAILRLASPVTLNSYVNIACLPGNDPLVNDNVMIAGWGTTSFQGSLPDPLLQANITIMDTCRLVYNFDANSQLCAGNSQYTKDSCQGDSGGPLMFEVNGQWIVSGIVSYGDECAKAYYPGVYTRVKNYLPWINQVLASSSGK